jgi:hypothetical protein
VIVIAPACGSKAEHGRGATPLQRVNAVCKIHGLKGPASSGTLACISLGYVDPSHTDATSLPNIHRDVPVLTLLALSWLGSSGQPMPTGPIDHFNPLHYDTNRSPFALPVKVWCLARIEPTTSGSPRNGCAGAATNGKIHGSKDPASSGTLACISMGYVDPTHTDATLFQCSYVYTNCMSTEHMPNVM